MSSCMHGIWLMDEQEMGELRGAIAPDAMPSGHCLARDETPLGAPLAVPRSLHPFFSSFL